MVSCFNDGKKLKHTVDAFFFVKNTTICSSVPAAITSTEARRTGTLFFAQHS